MCGIFGLYNTSHDPRSLEDMSSLQAHRGPDAEGFYQDLDGRPRVLIGHRRLSIIDLSSGANQPFEKNGLVLAYNGEIYNFRDLRSRLEGLGARFRTTSDTEVIVEAWSRWGAACLPMLRGMFAIALYDSRSGHFFLARDPFGIKPLFFARVGQGVAFASELKALRSVFSPEQARIDTTALVASLLYSWIPETHCILRGAAKLQPGTLAEFRPDGTTIVTRHWNPREELGAALEAPEPTAEELSAVLEDSVRAHLVADVPVATFLSGGLDSSLVTVLASRDTDALESYTISFREEDRRFEAMPDDLRFARILASAHGIRLHEIEVEPRAADLLPSMARAMDEPVGDAAAINAYLICRAARARGGKVLLSGVGADELFGGYRKHLAGVLAAHYRRLPRALRSGVVRPVVERMPVATSRRGLRSVRWAKRFLSFADLPAAEGFQRSYTHYSSAELRELMVPDLRVEIEQLNREHEELFRECPSDDLVTQMCYVDLNLFLPSLNLTYTDRASMAASTEVRVPFVDREVVRAAFRVRANNKIRGFTTKSALKEVGDLHLPREIVHRPKALFSAPLRAWIRRDLSEQVDDMLRRGRLAETGVLDGEKLGRMIQADRDGSSDFSKQIWHLMTLEHWLDDHHEHRGASNAGSRDVRLA